MDNFQLKVKLEEVGRLTTKKRKQEMFEEFLYEEPTVNGFKVLTYLIKLYPFDIKIGTSANSLVTSNLLDLIDENENIDKEDLMQYCDSEFALTDFHREKLFSSRYLPFQAAAHLLKKGI